MLKFDFLLLQVEDSLLQIVVFNHKVRRGVILGEAIVDRVAHGIGLGSSDTAVSLDCRADEDVFKVLKLVLELSVFEHDVLKVALSQVLDHTNLVVLLTEAIEFILILLE